MTKLNPHNPEYHTELTPERIMVLDDVCHTIPEKEFWDRARTEREARVTRLHAAAVAAKAKFDASGDPADLVAYEDAFERWISG